jgi:lysophospholipase L1-like esterase
MRKLKVVLFFLTINFASKAQIFPSGSRVCFVGNSITNNGEFHHNILLYHLTRFPKDTVDFNNCGISGDVTGGIINRMDDDILVHQPTHIVLMIGMNDVKRSLYGEQPTANADTLVQRQKAIELYKVNLEKIITLFLEKKIKVILQKPTIYDQTAKLPTKNNLGVNDALKICADFVGVMANKYQLQVVDYWTIMNGINQQLQVTDSAATLTSKDRVHPQSTGHFVMAYQFLATTQAPKYVAKIGVTTNGKTDSAQNCTITKFKKRKQDYVFTVVEKSLPFPMNDKQANALELVPFIDSFNQQIVQIPGIPSGNYSLKIDDNIIGNFNDTELATGINIALQKNTPQYLQAEEVSNTLNELWRYESNLRSIKFLEYNSDFKKCVDVSSLQAIKACLEPVFKKKDNDYFMQQLNKYMHNKPLEAKFILLSNELRKKAIVQAKPNAHIFKLTRIN